jgi:hypothetical protein
MDNLYFKKVRNKSPLPLGEGEKLIQSVFS